MPDMITLRELCPGDIPFMRAMLYEMVFIPDNKPPLEEVLSWPGIARYVCDYGRAGDFGLLAELRGEPVGAAWCRLFPVTDPGYGFVAEDIPELSIAVDGRLRGRGVGSMLLDAIMEQARHRSCRAVSLSVDRANPAYRLYLSRGFRDVPAAGTSVTMLREF
jgi:GNAT superfamily N-acetyltransferase